MTNRRTQVTGIPGRPFGGGLMPGGDKMFCSNCGELVLNTDMFCGHCGAQIRQPLREGVPEGQNGNESFSLEQRGQPSLTAEVVESLLVAFLRQHRPIDCEHITLFSGGGKRVVHGCKLVPTEIPLVLFGSNSRFGTISLTGWCGVLFTSERVYYKMRHPYSMFQWRISTGNVPYASISSIELQQVSGDFVLFVNQRALGIFLTSKDEADEKAVELLGMFCEDISSRTNREDQRSQVEEISEDFSVEELLNGRQKHSGGAPFVTAMLIAICLSVAVVQQVKGCYDNDGALCSFANEICNPKSLSGYLVTGFQHTGWVHLALNMWCLGILGNSAEKIFGHAKCLVVYLLCTCVGSITENLFEPELLGFGASGGVFGLAGLLLVYGCLEYKVSGLERNLHFLQKRAILKWMSWNLAWIGGNLLFTFRGARVLHISIGAHVGGLVAGAVLGGVLWLVSMYVVKPNS